MTLKPYLLLLNTTCRNCATVETAKSMKKNYQLLCEKIVLQIIFHSVWPVITSTRSAFSGFCLQVFRQARPSKRKNCLASIRNKRKMSFQSTQRRTASSGIEPGASNRSIINLALCQVRFYRHIQIIRSSKNFHFYTYDFHFWEYWASSTHHCGHTECTVQNSGDFSVVEGVLYLVMELKVVFDSL